MNIIQVYKKYPTQNDCLRHLEGVRWRGNPTCPYCKSPKFSAMEKECRYHCNSCNTSYSVTVGTIFHKTHVDLQKWFLAISIILNARKGISSRQMARDLEVNKNTAWYMGMRIRKAMTEQRDLLTGVVEMDETYLFKDNKEKDKNGQHKRGRGTSKRPIVGMMERGGRVIAQSVHNVKRKTLQSLVRRNVDTDKAVLYTDEYTGYIGMSEVIKHGQVKHKEWYVNGDIHTNSIESFWALLKRGIVGQFHKVSFNHLDRYIDEFCYRHNNRNNDRVFDLTISKAVGGVA